jgi:hypothetical protein
MIVVAEQGQRRVEQPRLLEVQPGRIRPVQRAQPSLAEPVGGPPRRLVLRGQADLERLLLAPLEDAQHVARLAHLEARQRVEERQDALLQIVGRRLRRGQQTLRHAVGTVGLAEVRALEREAAVVVGGGRPQHRSSLHHALLDGGDLARMTAPRPARAPRDAEIAGIDELHELRALAQQVGVGVSRVRRARPRCRVARQHVGLLLGGIVGGRPWARALGRAHLDATAVTIGAAELHGRGHVHARRVGPGVTGQAAGALAIGVGLALLGELGLLGLGLLRLGRSRRLSGRLLLGRPAADALGELQRTALVGGGDRHAG